MRRDSDRPHPRSTATVRYRERLVQVDVTHVGADLGGAGQSHLRVHVRAVHVDLSAIPMHDVTDVANRILEHPVGRRIGDHERAERLAMRLGLGPHIVQVDVPAIVARHDDHAHAGHRRRGRVGPMRRRRDQDDVTPSASFSALIGPDDHESGKLPLRAGVGLQRHRREPRDGAQ